MKETRVGSKDITPNPKHSSKHNLLTASLLLPPSLVGCFLELPFVIMGSSSRPIIFKYSALFPQRRLAFLSTFIYTAALPHPGKSLTLLTAAAQTRFPTMIRVITPSLMVVLRCYRVGLRLFMGFCCLFIFSGVFVNYLLFLGFCNYLLFLGFCGYRLVASEDDWLRPKTTGCVRRRLVVVRRRLVVVRRRLVVSI